MTFYPFAPGATSSLLFAPTGLPGATAASRYVGATTGGPPLTGTFAAGDYVVDETGPFWVCTVAGTPGTWVPVAPAPPSGLYKEPFIAGATTPPINVTAVRGAGSTTVSPASGTAMFNTVPLLQGQVISALSLLSLGAQSGGSHCWVALCDPTGKVVAVSADNPGATFWAGNTAKTLTFTAPYTVAVTGLYICVFGMTATGMATFVGGTNLDVGEAGWGLGNPVMGTAGALGAPPALAATLTLTAAAAANLKFVLS